MCEALGKYLILRLPQPDLPDGETEAQRARSRRAARNLGSSFGPCKISFHALSTLARETRRCLFPIEGNRGTEGLGPLAESSVLCLWDPCSEPDAWGASLGRTSRLCADQPTWAPTRASLGAHAGSPWGSRRHPWSSREHPLELRLNADCAFLWRHYGLGSARGRTPLHSAASLVEGDRGGPDLAGQPSGLCHGVEATPGRPAPWTPTLASVSSPEPC